MADPITFSRRSFIVMPLALAACKFGQTVLRLSGQAMGTTYNVVAVDAPVGEAEVRRAIEGELVALNAQMSNWAAGSEVARFNAQSGSVRVSNVLADVVRAAQQITRATGGAFDIAAGPLIDLWGFGAGTSRTTPPAAAQIAQAQAAVGQVALDGDTLRKTDPGASLYLSGIGKGHGIDRFARALAQLGLTDYMIEVGGDLYAAGKNPDGQPWQIGIESPDGGPMLRMASVSGRGLATSGDYRQFFEADGQRYSHLIDPRSGRPVTHGTASATVIADNAMLADAWATAMLVLGREAGLELAEAQGLAVLFVERDGLKMTASSAFGVA